MREVAHGHTKITPQMAADPAFGIAYMAWRMAGKPPRLPVAERLAPMLGYNPASPVSAAAPARSRC